MPQKKKLKIVKVVQRRRRGGCSGECSGEGQASEYTDGECPEDCSKHEFEQKTIDMAQIRARDSAIRRCQERGDADCICTGGKYVQDGKPTCETIDKKEGGKECKYTIKYKYTNGTCNTLA